jgi:hypothetical protein
MKQKSDGCDYSIACGQKLSFLKSETFEEVEEEVRNIVEDHGGFSDECSLKSFLLIEVADAKNMNYLIDEHQGRRREAEEAETRKRELKKLEELKKKYGEI